MKIILIFLSILLVSCGIEKQPAPAVVIISTGDLDPLFSDDGFLAHDGAAGGNLNDEGFAVTINDEKRTIIVGQSVNSSGDTDLAVWAYSFDGSPDTAFSGDGLFIHNDAAGGNGNDAGLGVVADTSGNIYIAGYSENGSGFSDLVVWKIKPNGTLDNSFSGDGIFSHNSAAGGNRHDQGHSIALDSSGNLFVTGYSDQTATNRDMALWKIKPNGNLDTTFSGDGIVTSDSAAGGEDDIGTSIFLDASNNIFIAGRADRALSLADMAVWKYTSSGILDNSFSDNGIFTHNNAAGGNAFDAATGIVTNEEGNLYVSGYSRNTDNNNDMVVWKLFNSGVLDPTFNTDGIFVFDISPFVGSSVEDTGEAIALDSLGNVIVVGSADDDMSVWRLTEDGELDPRFNGDGVFSHDSAAEGLSTDTAQAIYFNNEIEQLTVTGYSLNSSGNFDMAIWRLN